VAQHTLTQLHLQSITNTENKMKNLNEVTNIDAITKIVVDSYPSIYSKNDVIKLLEMLKLGDEFINEEQNKKVCGEQLAFTELIDAMQEDIKYAIENYEPELDEYSLSMEYNNEVVIDSHTADMKPLKNDVRDLLNNFREEFVKLISE